MVKNKSTFLNVVKVTTVIPNWNGKHFLNDCLNSLISQKGIEHKIVVIDNGSSDGSVEFIQSNFPSVFLIENKENLGTVIAENQGIRLALSWGSDFIFILNNDTIVKEGTIKTLVDELEKRGPDYGIAGPKIINPDGTHQFSGAYFKFYGTDKISPEVDEVTECDLIYSTAELIRKELYENIGLLDEAFEIAYAEDDDFCIRARFAGYRTIYVPQAQVMHFGTMTSSRINSLKVERFRTKNLIRFRWLNYPVKWIIRSIQRDIRELLLQKQVRLSSYFLALIMNTISLPVIIAKRTQRGSSRGIYRLLQERDTKYYHRNT